MSCRQKNGPIVCESCPATRYVSYTISELVRFVRVEYNEDIWLWRSVTQYTFPWNGRINFTAEQTSEDGHNLTMLFSWTMKDNTDLYFLLNDYEVDGEKIRAAFFKIVYRF